MVVSYYNFGVEALTTHWAKGKETARSRELNPKGEWVNTHSEYQSRG